ncbi:MAG: 50S ribosomal protein L11 methyltransferase [Zhenhengia sp.]
MADEGTWIASGIIQMRKDDVIAAIEANGFEIVEIHEQKEWVAVVARRRK